MSQCSTRNWSSEEGSLANLNNILVMKHDFPTLFPPPYEYHVILLSSCTMVTCYWASACSMFVIHVRWLFQAVQPR